MNSPTSTKLTKHLAYDTVAYADVRNNWGTKLVIFSASSLDENVWAPSESVTVSGIEGVKELHKLCEEAIQEHEK